MRASLFEGCKLVLMIRRYSNHIICSVLRQLMLLLRHLASMAIQLSTVYRIYEYLHAPRSIVTRPTARSSTSSRPIMNFSLITVWLKRETYDWCYEYFNIGICVFVVVASADFDWLFVTRHPIVYFTESSRTCFKHGKWIELCQNASHRLPHVNLNVSPGEGYCIYT